MDKSKINVYVGMSGGVDSSVTAALLKEQGYNVTGVYMKNWTQDLPGFACPWADDLADAKRVAVQLDIPFEVFDFQREYKQHVVDYMIAEYQAGRTPNPDIMCNQEIKFDLFLKTALAGGADMIATGHYARIGQNSSSFLAEQGQDSAAGEERRGSIRFAENEEGADRPAGPTTVSSQDQAVLGPVAKKPTSPLLAELRARESSFLAPPNTETRDSLIGEENKRRQPALLTGLDKNKDQSYFLYRVTSEALSRTLLPIGELTKPQVRDEARKLGLATAEKKDSQGICFVGKVGVKEFLQNYIDAKPGNIIDKKSGKVIGQHDGAIFYTIGQRHGLKVGGGLPYYVVGKNMDSNEVFVTRDLNDENLWRDTLNLTQLHWINEAPKQGQSYQVRTRYRAQLIDCMIERLEGDEMKVHLQDADRALTAGQSTVLYDGERVVGGGIVV